MDGQDWYVIVGSGQPCPECGYDAQEVLRADLGPQLLGEARRWGDLLGRLRADEEALRRRPTPDTWSAIEYACHVAGVFEVFAGRVERLRGLDGAVFPSWDHEAAATEDRYAERDVDAAMAAIADGAVHLALSLPRPGDTATWERAGTRDADAARFTIEGIARYALHESVHHRQDAERVAGLRTA